MSTRQAIISAYSGEFNRTRGEIMQKNGVWGESYTSLGWQLPRKDIDFSGRKNNVTLKTSGKEMETGCIQGEDFITGGSIEIVDVVLQVGILPGGGVLGRRCRKKSHPEERWGHGNWERALFQVCRILAELLLFTVCSIVRCITVLTELHCLDLRDWLMSHKLAFLKPGTISCGLRFVRPAIRTPGYWKGSLNLCCCCC